ncbi:conserved Plasmodium protein, unknown function [Plasmodium knowlesi strain H]|uniref:Uncharacterized protein n=3 Tax=Plasmodium knowlesi TaxID=5850 RepID=A0A5K1UUA2_PLAKH|nr:conserved Plasmodium protein, unknown function [Plasmodium knowlesi strain H]OTN63738.1 Uncharacterized protein PKNOH_S140244600 [Plasmodium knowlesi]CAA9990865.1 conserved Plasmodium protein, unknown function [Plasmodium knowlesi strain H]SBO20912.1 conserved Plasmodium protein, unknown function [Plasmodium knowlesi strain H]SBO21401.1 conserved Plasmodium protein, unknown function [Plasmodium knowlesi strain H]VVS80339.1 conserved Plasmodium protein, unknown function [Plasmodium knowlesi |eukprot:XP_002262153.1 hypothetical protein, conserved in Plasmodium species [Plasmodium knowlesi strain H]
MSYLVLLQAKNIFLTPYSIFSTLKLIKLYNPLVILLFKFVLLVYSRKYNKKIIKLTFSLMYVCAYMSMYVFVRPDLSKLRTLNGYITKYIHIR